MFTSDRRNAIQQIIAENEKADVSELAQKFHVSEVTIRKDLVFLEKNGIVIRTHGGAVARDNMMSPSGGNVTPPELHRLRSIAKLAAYYIADSDFIYLGTGAVCSRIAEELIKKEQLTVLTNNVTAIALMAQNPNLHVISTPGSVISKNGETMLAGTDTIRYLKDKYVDKAIISPDAVKLNMGYSVQDSGICDIYKVVMENADDTLIAVTSDCFNKNAFSFLGDLSICSRIITDERIPDTFTEYYSNHDIQVFTSYDLHNLEAAKQVEG